MSEKIINKIKSCGNVIIAIITTLSIVILTAITAWVPIADFMISKGDTQEQVEERRTRRGSSDTNIVTRSNRRASNSVNYEELYNIQRLFEVDLDEAKVIQRRMQINKLFPNYETYRLVQYIEEALKND